MPHRILISNYMNNLGDGLAILGFSVMATIESFTVSDLTGPHALLLAALGVVGILWRNNAERDKKDEARAIADNTARDKRHTEMMDMQKANAADLKQITVSSIRANVATAAAVKTLVKELERRPCAANLPKIRVAEQTDES